MLLMAVDGGKTKTSCMMFDEQGRILAFSASGPTGLLLPLETIKYNLWIALESCISAASVHFEDIVLIVFGLSDLDTMKDRVIAQSLINSLPLPPSVKVLVEHDMITAYYAVTYGEPGIAVIAGTGSIAFGKNEKGEAARALGWGWIFDDEGSAFWIARKALLSAAKYYDGRGPKTSLMDALIKEFNLEDFLDIIYVVQRDMKRDPAKIAKIAKIVDKVAAEGDDVARGILTDAGVKLAEAACCVARRLDITFKPIIVGGVGSVFKSTIVNASFSNRLTQELAQVRIRPPLFEYKPVIGSAVLALKNLGVTDIEKIVEKLETSLNSARMSRKAGGKML